MIFVTLGTQDKEFTRLLEAIDREIENGTIKDKVVVQAGLTKYESKNMEIFDLIPQDKFDEYIKKSDLIITHGGAGSILTAVKNNKKIIAAARLERYNEHTNDHQKQIVKEFSEQGYIMELRDFTKLGKLIEKSKTFKPKKFVSNTHNMIKIIDDYIEETNHVSWYNKYKETLLYLFFGGLTVLVNIVSYFILRELSVSLNMSNLLAWVFAVLFAFFTNKIFVFESKARDIGLAIKECISFFGFRIVSLSVDMGLLFLMVQVLGLGELFFKIVSNIIVIILNYIFSKVFIFKNAK